MKKIIITIIIILAIIAVIVYANNFSGEENENINSESEIEEFSEISEISENISDISENISEDAINSDEEIDYENFTTNITEAEVTQVAFPTGFMGSSLYKVVLFSNGDVYVQKFDGEDENLENIISEELIAEGALSVTTVEDEEDTNYGKVIINGGTAVKSDYGWIEFTNGDGS